MWMVTEVGHVDREQQQQQLLAGGWFMVEDTEWPGLLFVWPGGSHDKETVIEAAELLRRQRQRWQLPGPEPRKSPAILLELCFFLSNTCGQIWLLLSHVSMTSFASLLIFEVNLAM